MKTFDNPLNMSDFDRWQHLIKTWERAYNVTCPSKKQKENRLKELLSWDNSNNNVVEHNAKVNALQNLLA